MRLSVVTCAGAGGEGAGAGAKEKEDHTKLLHEVSKSFASGRHRHKRRKSVHNEENQSYAGQNQNFHQSITFHKESRSSATSVGTRLLQAENLSTTLLSSVTQLRQVLQRMPGVQRVTAA